MTAGGAGLLALVAFLAAASAAGTASGTRIGTRPVGGNGALLIQDIETNLRLFVLDPGSRRPRLVRGIKPSRVVGGAWSPDGLRFAVGSGGVLVVDVRAGRISTIVPGGADPAWSPDGARLAYSAGGWIWIKALGRAATRFVRGSEPTWSPDGKAIAYTGDRGIFVTTFTGETRQLLRDGPYECAAFAGDVSHDQPDWSPNGYSIAFTRSIGCGTTVSRGIAFVTLEGETTREPLHSGADDGPSDPTWSPDGMAIAFAESYENSTGRIASYRSDGRISTRLKGDWSLLDWQPLCSVMGSARADRLAARRSDDLVCGLAGADRIAGGLGEDRLFGEGGDDRFFARDGEFDVIGCGAGRDSVEADRGDLVGPDCERVAR